MKRYFKKLIGRKLNELYARRDRYIGWMQVEVSAWSGMDETFWYAKMNVAVAVTEFKIELLRALIGEEQE